MKFIVRVVTERRLDIFMEVSNAELDTEGVLTQFDIEDLGVGFSVKTKTVQYIDSIVKANKERWAEMFWEEILLGAQKAYRECYNQ